MSKLGVFIRRRALWAGFLAAFVPLLLVLGLQFWWLLKLQRTSTAAGNAVLAGFLDSVTTAVLYSYGPGAERALDVPPAFFTQDRLDKVAAHFRKKEMEGAKTLFVVQFSNDGWGTILVYDPETEAMRPARPSDETRAITIACAPWKLMHSKAIELGSARLYVEERDPANRVIMNPITDPSSRVIGVAGAVLDADYFSKRVLPAAIRASLPKFFPRAEDVAVTVRDGCGTIRFATDPGDTGSSDVERAFSFVFTDHRLGIHSRRPTPAQLARAGFAFNVALSLLSGALLAGGLALVVRTAAREMRLSQMKSDFVSNVSHELRTPLASIRVFGELLRLGRATTLEKAREYGDYIETESRRLTQLIHNILDFSKIESGRKEYRFERGDVGEVLADTIGAFEKRLQHSGFVLDFERSDEPLPPVRIDAAALGQAFHNLLDNAVKYSGESRWIGVRLERRDESVVVSFQDRGIGIPKDEQRKIFDRFHRVGTGLVHDVRGSGLGLSIVRHVVEAHGGRVTVESEPGHGSVFSIHLPIGSGAETGASARSAAAQEG